MSNPPCVGLSTPKYANINQKEVSFLHIFCLFTFLIALYGADRQVFNATLASKLSDSLHTMLTHTSSERGRTAVPLITNATGISPFPIKIEVKVGGVTVVA